MSAYPIFWSGIDYQAQWLYLNLVTKLQELDIVEPAPQAPNSGALASHVQSLTYYAAILLFLTSP